MLTKFLDYAHKNKRSFIIACVMMCVALIVVGAVFRVGVHEDSEYCSSSEVALYLIEYHHLPSNYITKAEAEEQYGTSSYQPGDNKYIGGDVFYYSGTIVNYTSTTTLYECDVDYTTTDSNTRGQTRLVFTYDGEVYVTYDHYATFSALTPFIINFKSNLCFILAGAWAGVSTLLCIYAYIIKKPTKDEQQNA